MGGAPQKVEGREDHQSEGQCSSGQDVTDTYVGQDVPDDWWFSEDGEGRADPNADYRPTRWVVLRRKLRAVKITNPKGSASLAKR